MSNRPSMQASSEQFLYGVHPVREVLKAGKRRGLELFLEEKAAGTGRFEALTRLAQAQRVPVREVPRQSLVDLCDSREHQGAVLRTTPYPYTELGPELFEQPRLLLLDNIEDPRNAGAILRSAEIFGFSTVLLPLRGAVEVFPSVVKTSAGATEYLSIVRAANANKYVQTAIKCGYRVVVMDAQGTVPLHQSPVQDLRPLLLVIGGEDKRVGQFILNSADQIVAIPQFGKINSLNASVAAGVALYHFSGRGRDGGQGT